MQHDRTDTIEQQRLAALDDLDILDTAPEQGFDDVVRLATRLCDAPIALVSLVAADRQWFKARIGFPHCETDLDRSVCKFALAEPDLLVIPDLTADPRTRTNRLVTGDPHIRFYAGAPLRSPDGFAFGTLCVIDTVPRPGGLTAEQADDLRALGRQVTDQLALRRAVAAERAAQVDIAANAARLEAMIATQGVIAGNGTDLETVFAALVAGALRVIDAATGATIELREGDELVYRMTAGAVAADRGLRLPLHGTLSGRVLLDQRPRYCPDTQADRDVDPALARQLGIGAMIVVPVFRQGIAVGVLKVLSDKTHCFAARDILMTQVLAGLVASGFGEVVETQTRLALHDAETRYKAIFDSAVDFAIVAADADGIITDWNAGAERIFGWPVDDALGHPMDMFFTPEDRADGSPEHEERQARQAGSAVDERWHQRRNGERFWAVGRMMALHHENDGVRGYLKILQDRTSEWRREQRFNLIARASDALLASDHPAGALLPILMDGSEALGFDQSYTWDLDPAGEHLLLTHSVGVDPGAQAALRHVPTGTPLCGVVVETGRPLILANLQADDTPRYAVAREEGIDAYAGYPILAAEGLVGVISFAATNGAQFDTEALAFFATIARFLSLARARRDASRALTASDERSRRAQEGGRIGTFEVEIATGLVSLSPEMCRIYGLPEASIHPIDRITALVIPEDSALSSKEENRRAGTTILDVEYRIRRANDGALRWILRRARFERLPDGTPLRMFGTVMDITERRNLQEHQAALLGLGDRLRAVATTAEVAAVAAEILGRTLRPSRAGFAQIDVAADRFIVERDWTAPGMASLAGEHDLSGFHATIGQLAAGDPLAVDDIAASNPIGGDAQGFAAIGALALINVPLLQGGTLAGVLFVQQAEPRAWRPDEIAFAQGVADRAYAAFAKLRAEAAQHLLNDELSHRLKNTFAMVLSIASLSLRNIPDRGPVDAFEQRVRALASAHDILLRGSYAGAPLPEIVERVLHGTGQPDRFDVAGPAVAFGPQAALSMSLLLHELATNAAKYGALSNSDGRVALSWRTEDGGVPQMIIEWRETGGPAVVQPERRGFGSRIIRMGLAGTGGVDLDFSPAGLQVRIRAPLARLQQS